MGRRTRRRLVKETPDNFYFRPSEKEPENLELLTIAEFEAMRLKHYVNLNQNQAAEKMGVSQPTFSRIIEEAHKKVTRALLEGKQLKVMGGNVDIKKGFVGYGCLKCDYEWEDPSASPGETPNCPECGSKRVYYLEREPL